MYTPYQNSQSQQTYGQQLYNQQYGFQASGQPGLHHPQPQHFQQVPQGQQFASQQQQHPQQPTQDGFGNFFSDPASSMAAQFAKNSFGQSNTYIQQNFGSFIPATSDINYYFKVSNSYVLRKLALILFPYRHQNWNRLPNTAIETNSGSSIQYLPPTHDVNAPDLYVPLMAYVTYILLWSVFEGLKGDFHPELFASLASSTFACSIVDILIIRGGLYFFNATDFSFWDIVALSSYKYVSVIVLLCLKQMVSNSWLFLAGIIIMTSNLGLFLMRSLRNIILPHGVDHSNSISNSQRRLRLQSLFGYSVVVQGLLLWYMSS